MFLLAIFLCLRLSDDFTYDPRDSSAIQQCTTKASSIVIPASVKRIEGTSFPRESCPNLKTVTFENGSLINVIDPYSFANSVIETITFPPVNLSLGNYAFCQMEKLNTLNFTGTLFFIPSYCFAESPNLHYLYLAGEPLIYNTFLNLSRLNFTFVARSGFAHSSITACVVPENYNGRAFQGYENLFEHCFQLHSVRVDYSLPRIPTEMFHGCEELISVSIAGVQIMSNFNLDLTNSNVKLLMSGSFRESGIISVKIPSDFMNISNDAFAECTRLRTINIASSFDSFSHPDFQGMISLTDVTIGNKQIIYNKKLDLTGTPTTYVDAYEYSGTDLIEVTLPEQCILLFTSCFQDCEYLKKVTLSPAVELASHSIFSGCRNLDTIILGGIVVLQDGYFDVSPSSLRIIAISTFEFTSKINTLVICESLTVSKNAFRMSFGLNKIIFKSSNKIHINEDAFLNVPQIQTIEYTNDVKCENLQVFDFQKAFRGSNVENSNWCDFKPVDDSNQDTGLSTGAKAGIAIVVILVVAAIAVFIVWYLMKKTNLCVKGGAKGTLIME